MSQQPTSRPRVTGGRETELLHAVLDVLREAGYEALTMDAVAARGQCSKGTIYRLWGSKPRMVAAALRAIEPAGFDAIDTGSLREDLVGMCEQLLAPAQKSSQLFAALTHAALRDAELAAAMREALFDPDLHWLSTAMERAAARGELSAVPPMDFLPGIVVGGLLLHPLFHGDHADTGTVHRFVDEIMLPSIGAR